MANRREPRKETRERCLTSLTGSTELWEGSQAYFFFPHKMSTPSQMAQLLWKDRVTTEWKRWWTWHPECSQTPSVLKDFYYTYFIYVCAYAHAHTHAIAYMWRSEDNLRKAGLSFFHALRLGNKCLYPLSPVLHLLSDTISTDSVSLCVFCISYFPELRIVPGTEHARTPVEVVGHCITGKLVLNKSFIVPLHFLASFAFWLGCVISSSQ